MGEVIALHTSNEGRERASAEGSAANADVIQFPVLAWVAGEENGFLDDGAADFPASMPERPRLYVVPDALGEINTDEDDTQEEAVLLAAVHSVGHVATEGMGASAEVIAISDDDRFLTEVDHLNEHRLPDGSHSPWVYRQVGINQVTAVKEAVIPHAVSKTFQERKATGELDEHGRSLNTYVWLGKTAIEVAASGYQFHRAPDALERVDVEVDEAAHNDNTMREGFAKVRSPSIPTSSPSASGYSIRACWCRPCHPSPSVPARPHNRSTLTTRSSPFPNRTLRPSATPCGP